MRIRFGPYILDSGTRRLTVEDREIPLSPKAFDLLSVLAELRPNVVDKATLLARIWPDTHVAKANLNVLIGEIRRALADSPDHPAFIRTAHGVGFAFSADATDLDRPGTSQFWLAWKDETHVLAEGANLIGRDPTCKVAIVGTGVSRQHAKITVESATRRVVLEDLNSTNGTFLQRARVTSPVTLSDGDVVKVGAVELTFRAWFADAARPTERIGRRTRSTS